MPPDPPLPDLLPLVPAALALLVRSLAIAADAAAGAVSLEQAKELAGTNESARSLVRVKSDPESAFAAVRSFVALCLAIAVALVAGVAVEAGEWAGLRVAPVWTAVAGATVAWLFTAVTDVIPRSLAAMHPETWALATARFLDAVRVLMSPLTRVVVAVADVLLRPLGARVRFALPPPPLDELQRMLASSAEEGAPEPALVRSLFEFGDRTVKEIMVPRTDLDVLSLDAKADEVVQFFVEEGHTRVPVYKGTPDTIVGIVHVKDVMPLLANPELIILHDLLRPAIFVPWNRPIQNVLRELQRKKQHLAIVVDEYGGVSGIVTLEDIVEQIVGDIRDEFDEEAAPVVSAADGAALVQADMRVADFNEAFQAEVPTEEGFETLAGFLNTLAGAIPNEGDRFYYKGLELQVVKRDPRRVLEVRVSRTRVSDVPPPETRV